MRDTGEVRGRPPLDVLMSMRDRPVRDVNGDSFGKLVEVYYDKATRVPEWLGVDSSLFGMTRILVPTLDSRVEEDSIRVAFRKEVALGTPEVLDQEISQDLERNLYAHYGLAYTYDESPTGLPATPDALAHPPAREFQR